MPGVPMLGLLPDIQRFLHNKQIEHKENEIKGE
jgi:hypothetical protein